MGVRFATMGVAGLELDDWRTLAEHDVQFRRCEVNVGQRNVWWQKQPILVGESDLFVHPPIECTHVCIHRLDIVCKLILDVVCRCREHQRSLDTLFVHER